MAIGTAYSTYDNYEVRTVFPVPLADEFFNNLQDRLSACVENILFGGDSRFTLLINAVDRSGIEPKTYNRGKIPDFIYAGCSKQRELLENNVLKNAGKTVLNNEMYKKAWDYLSEIVIVPEESVESAGVYGKIQEGEYTVFNTCEIKYLNEYFGPSLREEQEIEKSILGEFFDLQQDVYISVPLIGYAEFDGLVHIIFKRELLYNVPGYLGEKYLPESVIWPLLRTFIIEYDGLFLDWDFVDENLDKVSAINHFLAETVFRSEYFFDDRKNPILRELKLQQYYQTHKDYFTKRLKLNENVPGRVYQQYVTNAVTAILIDSYAHNVSAHALSTLSWWYYRRAGRLKDEEMNWDALLNRLKNDPYIDQRILADFHAEIDKRRITRKTQTDVGKREETIRQDDGLEVINYPGSLTREMARLLRFLTEKGAYWGGVTRDASVGGKISSLYSVLWHDFINNPFYIGTVAKTEDILHIKMRIVLYDAEEEGPRPAMTSVHRKTFRPENDGILAWVDLKNPRKELHNPGDKTHEDVISAFVHKGEKFNDFRTKLKKIRIFFPGGVVGQHAFYTMIENEIRNVKHYNREELKILQNEGLTIAIGIQACSLHNSQAKELYRISIWLDTPTRLGKGEKHILWRKWETLQGEIFDEQTYAPLLGGTQQDKVCAAFLMNGHFSYVQRGDRNANRNKNKDSDRDRQYYPWVRPGCSDLSSEYRGSQVHTDYKMSYNTPLDGTVDFPENGYLKKIFYLWRGERLLDWHGENLSDWDNSSRFVVVRLEQENSAALLDLRREKGMARVVVGNLQGDSEPERFASAYKLWLKKLLGDQPLYALVTTLNGNPDYILALDNRGDSLRFIYQEVGQESPEKPSIEDVINENMRTHPHWMAEWRLPFVHGGEQSGTGEKFEIRYRNHGILKNYFFPKSDIPAYLDDSKMMELFELLATKVCIFDSRIYQRMRLDERRDEFNSFLRNKLKLAVHKEGAGKPNNEMAGWLVALTEEERLFMRECHFLVMHLSFIESILQNENPELRTNDPSNVGLFIEKQIMPLVGYRDNFFFVVTTGRGRNEWWASLGKDDNKRFARFTLFRPIESLLTAIENSIGMEDDVELKYRIVKILYGS